MDGDMVEGFAMGMAAMFGIGVFLLLWFALGWDNILSILIGFGVSIPTYFGAKAIVK